MIYRPALYTLASVYSEWPLAEPVTAEEAKEHGNLSSADSTDLVEFYLRTAREHLESRLHRFIVPRTVTYRIDRFPTASDELIELPGGKVTSLTSIAYTDTNGDAQTLAASAYSAQLDSDRAPATIGLAYGATWPAVRAAGLPVTITYAAGWTAEDTPRELQALIRLLAQHLFDHRDAQADGARPEESLALRMIIDTWRISRVA